MFITDMNSEILNSLILFARTYTHLLFKMDDEEFFQQKPPFNIEALPNMINLLKVMNHQLA